MKVDYKSTLEPLPMSLNDKAVHRLQIVQQGKQGLYNDAHYDDAQSSSELSPGQLDQLRQHLHGIQEAVSRVQSEHTVSKSLLFDDMYHRFWAIPEAHDNTFDWIHQPSNFEETDPRSQVHFEEWLLHGDGIYWISGKPGSGKSTLMKHISNDHRTADCLRVWGNGDVSMSSFYFWMAGTEMQRSQQGLLQQFLFELLSRDPTLIPEVCPDRFGMAEVKTMIFNKPWHPRELRTALCKLKHVLSRKTRLFIDGLDEYVGDHVELIEIIRDLSDTKNIKLCVSSRPWPCFEDAFGKDSTRKLYLQDLTREDIREFVWSKLQHTPGFLVPSKKQHIYDKLISQIVDRAQGVFLWAFLVIRSLREGIANGDDLDTLHARLQELPSDLEDFFKRLIESVDKVYRKSMAETFQVALRSTVPLRVTTYHCMENLEEDSVPYDTPPTAQIVEEIMIRKLNGRYKGLLEAVGMAGVRTVVFLPRTVRDYLQTKEMLDLFSAPLPIHFNAAERISQALVVQAHNYPWLLRSKDVELFMLFTHHAEMETGHPSHSSIDQFRAVLLPLRTALNQSDADMREVLVRHAHTSYLDYLAHRDPFMLDKYQHSILLWLLDSGYNDQTQRVGTFSILKTLKWALDHGANPNQATAGGPTIFSVHLTSIAIAELQNECLSRSSEAIEGWKRVLLLLFDYGADINQALRTCEDYGWPFTPNVPEFACRRIKAYSNRLVEIYRIFFDHGLDPNVIPGHRKTSKVVHTLWESWLSDPITAEDFYLRGELIMLFLIRGADPRKAVSVIGNIIENKDTMWASTLRPAFDLAIQIYQQQSLTSRVSTLVAAISGYKLWWYSG
jgi:hypothetical protein